MRSLRLSITVAVVLPVSALIVSCDNAPREQRPAVLPSAAQASVVRIDPRDTAAYAEAGSAAVAAVSRCRPPRCRPDIFRGPGRGELTVGLDSANQVPGHEYQWHLVADTVTPASKAAQDAAWRTMVTRWGAAKPQRLVLVDGVPRSFAYVRAQVALASVWDVREVEAKDARALSTDPAALNGAVVITTKSHAQAPARQ